MFYLNCFFIYSILGWILETLVGIVLKNNWQSGILTGPWTPIYGIGTITILFISNYLFYNLHLPRFIETIIVFFVVAIVLSFLECLGGVLIEKITGTVFWDYSNQRFSIGHYISLEMAFLWGVLSVIFIYLIHPLIKKLIIKIPIFITIILIAFFLIDLSTTFFIKIKK